MPTFDVNGLDFETAGISDLRISLRNQAADTVSLTATKEHLDEGYRWQYHDRVEITRDGEICFVGKVTKLPKFGDDDRESTTYQIEGPWCWLASNVYQQTIKIVDPADPYDSTTDTYNLIDQCISDVILGEDVNGAHVTTTDAIIDVLNYIIGLGAPLSIGSIFSGPLAPTTGATDITCAEAIRQLLRWTPDAVVWFDYTVNPPSINIDRRPNLAAVDYEINPYPLGDRCEILSLTVCPRPDLIPCAVTIHWMVTKTYNEAQSISTVDDIAPAGADGKCLNGITVTIPVAGVSVQTQKQCVKTRKIPEDDSATNLVTWWADHLVWLRDPCFEDIPGDLPFLIAGHDCSVLDIEGEIAAAGGSLDAADYPRELIGGNVPTWLTEDGTLKCAQLVCRAQVKWDPGINPTGLSAECLAKARQYFGQNFDRVQDICITIRGTDATSRCYTRPTSVDYGDSPLIGLAQHYWESLQDLHHEGSLKLCLADHNLRPGKVLNLKNGQPTWGNMRSLIQSVDIRADADAEITTVRYGPPSHLSPQDLLELIRTSRLNPARYRSGGYRTDAQIDDEQKIDGDDCHQHQDSCPVPGAESTSCPLGITIVDGQFVHAPGTLNASGPTASSYTGIPTYLTGSASDGQVWLCVEYSAVDANNEGTVWQLDSAIFQHGSSMPDDECPEWQPSTTDPTQGIYSPSTGKKYFAWATIEDGVVSYSACGPAILILCGPCDGRLIHS